MIPTIRLIYDIMFSIVESKYDKFRNDEIGNLGSALIISETKNETIDTATWYDWLLAVADKDIDQELTNKEYAEIESRKSVLTLEEGYAAAIRFLTWYANSVDSDEIREFVWGLTYDKWLVAADKVLGQKS